MKMLIVAFAVVAVAVLSGCATVGNLFEGGKEVALSEVPAPAITAAKDAVRGIVLTEAELEEEDGQIVYELEGSADGKTYEIEVTAEGKILEVEQDEEDD